MWCKLTTKMDQRKYFVVSDKIKLMCFKKFIPEVYCQTSYNFYRRS